MGNVFLHYERFPKMSAKLFCRAEMENVFKKNHLMFSKMFANLFRRALLENV